MKRSNSRSRQGAVLVCIIACLAVSTVLIALSIQSALRSRREVRLQLQLRQTELLCEAGVMRAAQKLGSDATYPGEQWVPPLTSETFHTPEVRIEVNSNQSPGQPEDNRDNKDEEAKSSTAIVTVTAKLDSHLDLDGPMQRTHQFHWQLPEPSTSTEPAQVTE